MLAFTWRIHNLIYSPAGHRLLNTILRRRNCCSTPLCGAKHNTESHFHENVTTAQRLSAEPTHLKRARNTGFGPYRSPGTRDTSPSGVQVRPLFQGDIPNLKNLSRELEVFDHCWVPREKLPYAGGPRLGNSNFAPAARIPGQSAGWSACAIRRLSMRCAVT